MTLILFWIKIFFIRLWDFCKMSPIIIITPIIIGGLLLITNIKLNFPISESQMNIILFVIYVYSIINSLKKIDMINTLLIYKGKAISFNKSRNLFLVKKTFISNIPFLLFIFLKATNVIIIDTDNQYNIIKLINFLLLLSVIFYSNYLLNKRPVVLLLSIFELVMINLVIYINILFSLVIYCICLSIIIYYIFISRNYDGEEYNLNFGKVKINSQIKASLQDYLTSSFLQPVLIILSIVAYIMLNTRLEKEPYDESMRIFILILISLISLCFYMIMDSIPKANWLFYSILKPSYKVQFKRILLFLMSFFGVFIVYSYCIILYLNASNILYYSVIIVFNLTFAICISLLTCNMLVKGILGIAFFSIIIYLGIDNNLLLLILVLPLLLLLLKSIIDHYGWYEL